MVRGRVRGADAAAGARLAGDRARRLDADPRADRQRQDAGRVSLVPRSADVRAGAAEQRRGAACSTSRRSRRWRSTSSATCARRSPASRRSPRGRGDAYRHAGDRHPHRRHAAGRARAVPARAGRHPDHDAGVAVSAADLERARGAPLDRHGHHRRDPRAGADQARRAPRAVARAARGASASDRRSASACRRRSGRSTKSRGFSAASTTHGQTRRQPHPAGEAAAPSKRRNAAKRQSDSRDRARRRVRRRIRATSATGRSPSSTPARRRR